ncbi:MAG: hypothetical protein L0Z50_40275 [Verrucomicrobiales bacterium]|nr:hypothetical protein [Verrucomicrobiales bacterium]
MKHELWVAVRYEEHSSFYRLLATRYDPHQELAAIEILNANPGLTILEWPGPDAAGRPFVKGSTALHYAANDGKIHLGVATFWQRAGATL